MGIMDLYDKNACNIFGRNNEAMAWTWHQYKENKPEMSDRLVLVDMIGHPILDSVPMSEELFSGKYPEGTHFALYCHSGGSSGYLQAQLSPMMPQYTFINIKGGIGAYFG